MHNQAIETPRPAPCRAANILLRLCLLLAAGLLCGCGGSSDGAPTAEPEGEAPENPKDPPIAVVVSEVVSRPIDATYTTSATLRADKRATVIARTSGVVEQLLVEEGDRVSSGQVLAVLENEEQRIAWEAARTSEETLRNELERAERLLAQQLLSEEEHETKRRSAEDARRIAALAKLTLERTEIRAPFSGVILVRHLDVGATVADGTAIYDIADLEPLFTDVKVPERHVASLAPGQSVRLVADATGQVVAGRIDRLGSEVDTDTATVKVVVAIPPRPGLRPGAFVRVAVVTDTHEDALVIPRSALVAEGRRWHLYRLNENGESVEKLEAELGYEERDRVEVLSVVSAIDASEVTPLAVGQRVVSRGAPALSDGARVDASEADAASEPTT